MTTSGRFPFMGTGFFLGECNKREIVIGATATNFPLIKYRLSPQNRFTSQYFRRSKLTRRSGISITDFKPLRDSDKLRRQTAITFFDTLVSLKDFQ
jgi:hypothetical protein